MPTARTSADQPTARSAVAGRTRFAALPGHSYAVETRDDLENGSWTNFFKTNNLPTPQWIELPVATNATQRFYRLVTPVSNP